MTAIAEVLEPGTRSLQELADEANREHALVIEAGESMVEHAIRAGEVLHAAKQQCEEGKWGDWIDAHWNAARITASLYMRLWRYRDQVRADGATSLGAARRHLVMIEAPHAPKREGKPSWVKQEAADLYAQGVSISEIARQLGISVSATHEWVNPEKAAKYKQRRRERGKRRTAERRAERERERKRQERLVVRKKGGARAEAYAMAERFQDVIGQAHREEDDREAREAWALAGEYHRKMRDEIVRALGVA